MNFDQLIRFAVKQGASDIHLQTGAVPTLRINGSIRTMESPPLSAHELKPFILSLSRRVTEANFDQMIVEGVDLAYALPDLCRFRCNIYSHLGTPALVMRVIMPTIRTIEELNLPPVLRDVALAHRGLALITGTTGSGKSTTLAAMIDLINTTYRCKVLTIEDPVEFTHANQKALVSQLEVGLDTPSFEHGLRQALRQDPDVILVGELRDSETMRMALRAADTGHQVFATVHSSNASQTIERVLAMVPPDERKIATAQLASALEAVVSQRLAVTKEGGRRPAMEILRGGAVTAKFILEGKLGELSDYIASRENGMQRFDQHLVDLYNEKAISGTEAMRLATSPEAVALGLRGIRQSAGRT
jgi:twitching motility protein PilT